MPPTNNIIAPAYIGTVVVPAPRESTRCTFEFDVSLGQKHIPITRIDWVAYAIACLAWTSDRLNREKRAWTTGRTQIDRFLENTETFTWGVHVNITPRSNATDRELRGARGRIGAEIIR
jgi:hypothetical protein